MNKKESIQRLEEHKEELIKEIMTIIKNKVEKDIKIKEIVREEFNKLIKRLEGKKGNRKKNSSFK